MEDSTRSNNNKNQPRIPLGINSFGGCIDHSFHQKFNHLSDHSSEQEARKQFGHNMRLAMACIEGSSVPSSGPAIPSDEASIRRRLKLLSQEITSQHADLLELLVRFDEVKGWQPSGAKHCAAWMNLEIGIGIQLSWEYLRVGRKLLLLPTLKALFRAGKLSWSKVRLITRVADEENEKLLCHAALDASVSDVKRFCEEYRWNSDNNNDNNSESENDRALKQWESRSFTWDETSIGATRIQLVLPPAIAQAFLNSVEHSLNQLEPSDSTMTQCRADAAVLMAETSLQNAGKEIAAADRYQVIVSVDATELMSTDTSETDNRPSTTTGQKADIPTKRPTITGAGPIATETAKRISCDCSISLTQSISGEPVNIGRKSRIWPNAMERAIKARDQYCVWPGCTQSRHLHIHHIKHWADGGSTSVNNAACLCSHHHTLVHEGGYAVQHIENDDTNDQKRLEEQFTLQQHSNDLSMFDFETDLRNNRSSFNKVRKLSPHRYRFRIVDTTGKDILNQSSSSSSSTQSMNTGSMNTSSMDTSLIKPKHSSEQGSQEYSFEKINEYTRVQCREPVIVSCYDRYINHTFI